MGVPSYFLWLVKKFESQVLSQNPPKRPPDNVFLDWNCGIHPAVKREGLDTLDQKLQAALDYLDDVFRVSNPQKLFYIAIDGVAPRAKMQQQRKRRFKSVQDARFTKALKKRHGMLTEAQLNGTEKEWDYNMISPGTVFMDRLAHRMRLHIRDRTASGGAWSGVRVVFSDSTIPGEGEHKIMEYIRKETLRTDSNMIYGLDSDLIFLTLINFRPHMYLLREQITFGKNLKVGRPSSKDHGGGSTNSKGGKSKVSVDIRVDGDVVEGDEVIGGAQEILEEDEEEDQEDEVIEGTQHNNTTSMPDTSEFDDLVEQLVASNDSIEPSTTTTSSSTSASRTNAATASAAASASKPVEAEWVFLSLDNLREVFLKIFNPYVSLGNLENFKIFGTRAIDDVLSRYYDERDFSQLAERMMTRGFYHSPETESQNLIIDYIFMSYMLGNDFLPALTSLQIKEGGLDQLIRAYKIVQLDLCQYLVNMNGVQSKSSGDRANKNDRTGSAGGRTGSTSGRTGSTGRSTNARTIPNGMTVNMPFLTKLLEILSAMEPAMLRTISINMYRRISNFHRSRRYTESTDYEKDMLDLDYVENKMPDYIQLGKPGWKERYYDVHFHLKQRNAHESRKYIMKICEQYYRGMLWTLEYYTQGCPDWSWEYPFHSSPTVSDMWEFCKSSRTSRDLRATIFHEGAGSLGSAPVTPIEQLMTILPPESAHLLPSCVGRLMQDPSSSLAVYYPLDFSLDIFGKRYRWECHPLLPTIPQDEIRAKVTEQLPYLTEEENRRNEVGEVSVH